MRLNQQNKFYLWLLLILLLLLYLYYQRRVFAQTSFQDSENLVSQITLKPAGEILATFTVDEQTYSLEEKVKNGQFDANLNFWSTQGETGLVDLADSPQTQAMQVASLEHPSSFLSNCFSQTLTNFIPPAQGQERSSWPAKNLQFSYQLLTQETLVAFDQPIVVAFINNQPVWTSGIQDILEWQQLDELTRFTTWQTAVLDLTPFKDQEQLNLKICAGNTGDLEQPSVALIKNITTQTIVLADANDFKLDTTSESTTKTIHYQYQENDQPVTNQQKAPVDLTIRSNMSGPLKYWLENSAGQPVFTQITPFNFLLQAPAQIQSWQVVAEADNLFSSLVTVPQGSQLARFDLRYCDQEFTEADWPDLKPVKILNLTPEFYAFPKTSGSTQLLQWQFPQEDWLQLNSPVYLAIKVCNVAHNCSPLSEVLSVTLGTADPTITPAATPTLTPTSIPTSTPTPVIGQVLINEVMANPLGDDTGQDLAGEWLELYNPTTNTIDLTGWTIVDAANNQIVIPAQTSIEPHSFVLIFSNKTPIFNNGGDTLALINTQGLTVDQMSYGSTQENLTHARIPDGELHWQSNLPATPNAANQVP